MSIDLSGQHIVIVGGTGGIGAALAQHAEQAGANVTAAGRTKVDITSETSIRDFFAAVGPMDHLVATAASVEPGAFLTGDIAAARRSMDGKFWSQYLCARYAQVTRSLLLFSGIYSRRPAKGVAIMAAANGAVEALCRALAVELAPVRVNALSPGLIQGTQAYAQMPKGSRDAMYAAAASHLPAGRVGDADAVAVPALALLASPYATGTVVDIDGGALLA